MHAVRNIRLCTKDCLCLYVCPTGATDTENGQIDARTCISGCRACVDACPSHAISLVPEEFPEQQEKADQVIAALMELLDSKNKQEAAAKAVSDKSEDPIVRQIADAIAASNRIQAEDLAREAGFMLPQSGNVKVFLKSLREYPGTDDIPQDIIDRLLECL